MHQGVRRGVKKLSLGEHAPQNTLFTKSNVTKKIKIWRQLYHGFFAQVHYSDRGGHSWVFSASIFLGTCFWRGKDRVQCRPRFANTDQDAHWKWKSVDEHTHTSIELIQLRRDSVPVNRLWLSWFGLCLLTHPISKLFAKNPLPQAPCSAWIKGERTIERNQICWQTLPGHNRCHHFTRNHRNREGSGS